MNFIKRLDNLREAAFDLKMLKEMQESESTEEIEKVLRKWSYMSDLNHDKWRKCVFNDLNYNISQLKIGKITTGKFKNNLKFFVAEREDDVKKALKEITHVSAKVLVLVTLLTIFVRKVNK